MGRRRRRDPAYKSFYSADYLPRLHLSSSLPVSHTTTITPKNTNEIQKSKIDIYSSTATTIKTKMILVTPPPGLIVPVKTLTQEYRISQHPHQLKLRPMFNPWKCTICNHLEDGEYSLGCHECNHFQICQMCFHKFK